MPSLESQTANHIGSLDSKDHVRLVGQYRVVTRRVDRGGQKVLKVSTGLPSVVPSSDINTSLSSSTKPSSN